MTIQAKEEYEAPLVISGILLGIRVPGCRGPDHADLCHLFEQQFVTAKVEFNDARNDGTCYPTTTTSTTTTSTTTSTSSTTTSTTSTTTSTTSTTSTTTTDIAATTEASTDMGKFGGYNQIKK